jgi:glutathione S-transferase
MPHLLYSPASPYSAKVRMAAAHAGIQVEAIVTDTNAEPPELIGANPLGKIPVWIADDGEAIFDSRVITQYLNRVSGGRLFPRQPHRRLEAERLEALADGVCDCLLAHVYERRFRPAELVHQPVLDRQWVKVSRALDRLQASPFNLPKRIHAGHIALRAMIGYLDLRFAGQWESGHDRLIGWAHRFDSMHPKLSALLPHTP